MNLLSLTGVHKAFGPRVILDGVTFGLDAQAKVGLIGDNGTGKSTLLKIITGEEPVDAGKIALRSDTRVGFLPQVPSLQDGKTARESLSEPFRDTIAAIARYESAAAEMADDAERWLAEIERLGGWDWMNSLEQVATQVGIDKLDDLVDNQSGGQRKRIALARLILSKPDIALFDEPTNHLDAATVEWLEAWITKSQAACIVVTHDRYFLTNVVSRMAELRDGRLAIYEGSYQAYLEARAEEEAHKDRTGHRRYRMLKAELEWARRSPKARTTKAKARLGRVDDLAGEVKQLRARTKVAEISLGDAPRLGKSVLELVDVHKRYDPDQPLVDGLSLNLRKGDRVGVIGANGSGKTTLLRLLLDEVKPDSGRIVTGANTKFAYFDQHRSALDPAKSVRQTVCPDGGDKVFLGGKPLHVASWLDRFAFGPDTHRQPVERLSGGERNRLALARFLLEDANFLLLDEPTNDLDLMTMHVLEEALVGFPGCLLVVSHDRYFLDRVATHIVAFEDTPDLGREVSVIVGDYTTYRRLRQTELDARRAAATRQAKADKEVARQLAKTAPAEPEDAGPKPLSYKERRELEAIEPAIENAERAVATIETELADPSLWADGQAGAERGRALQSDKERLEHELEALYARWETLSVRSDVSG